MPARNFEMVFAMRMERVSSLFPDVTQQIHSLRAKGVMSSHALRAAASFSRTVRKSAGSLWATPEARAMLTV